MKQLRCRICQAETLPAGQVFGSYTKRWYALRHCPTCHFSFVAEPWTEYAAIYSEDYYRGKGADPYVDYVYEIEQREQTVRFYEWRGIIEHVRALVGAAPNRRWLDFGCGNGGLMAYGRTHTNYQIDGFEEGWIREYANQAGIPILTPAELSAREGTYDVVTAIEVLEHIVDPLAALRQIRRLLKPGGVFFYTTGNAQPFRDRLASWRYVIPEIHVSFYEPATLARALTLAGFQPFTISELPGWQDIIRYKILKGLGIHTRSRFEQLLPWKLLTSLADRRLAISAHPAARAIV